MPDELEERLKSHAKAFDGLLSLIPAKLYYGEDVSDQWQRKKQTPEQKRAAKMAKLDPDNIRSAKDVMEERAAAALKRKREDGESSDLDVGTPELPRELAQIDNPKTKKRKTKKTGITKPDKTSEQESNNAQDAEVEKRRKKAEQKAAKKDRKAAQAAKSKEKRDRQKARKEQAVANEPKPGSDVLGSQEHNSDDVEDDADLAVDLDIADTPINTNGTTNDIASTASPSLAAESPILSPILSPQLHSSTSSISSILPPPSDPVLSKPSEVPALTPALSTNSTTPKQTAKERLESRLNELRSARKADGLNGQPARNRQELLESRRKKEEERRAHKKELRRKAKEDEARKQEEEIARRFSPGGSGSLLASPRSPADPTNTNNFSFGRVAFGDGTHASANLNSLFAPHKPTKGPADPATALKAAQNKTSRLAGLDATKRAELEQKDMWLNAKKRAHGERVRDDTSLLKKALKRQESAKRKSDKEWTARTEGVAKGQEIRQKKREANLQKRKDEKKSGGGKKSAAGKGNKGAGSKKKVKRPGFEGTFKTRAKMPGGGGGGGKNKK